MGLTARWWPAFALLGLAAACRKHASGEPMRGEQVAIVAREPGASAEQLEATVAVPIERAVTGIAHVAHEHARIGPGQVTVELELEPGVPGEAIEPELRQRVAAILGQLPHELERPVIVREPRHVDVLRYTLRSDSMTSTQLTELDDRRVRPRLEAAPDVLRVETCGDQHAQLEIWLDPARLAARGLTVDDVARGIPNTWERPVGQPGRQAEFRMPTSDHADELTGLEIATRNGASVRLADVAVVRDGLGPQRCRATINGLGAIAGTVSAARTGDVGAAHRALDQAIAQVRAELPAGVTLDVLPRVEPVELEVAIDWRDPRLPEALELVRGLATVLVEARPAVSRVLLLPEQDEDPHRLEDLASRALQSHGLVARDPAAPIVQLLGPDRGKLGELARAAADALAAHHLEAEVGSATASRPESDGLPVGMLAANHELVVLKLDQQPAQVARSEERAGAGELLREDGQPCVAVRTSGDAAAVTAALAQLVLPAGYRWQLAPSP